MNDQQIAEFNAFIASKQAAARRKPNQLVRVAAGFYFLYRPQADDIAEITSEETDEGRTYWQARAYKGNSGFIDWYSDPYRTLKEAYEDLKEYPCAAK